MSTNRISAKLSQEDLDAIFAAIALLREKLPFLIELSADERKSLPRLGDKSIAFVTNALELAEQNPGFLARDFDLEEAQLDFNLFLSIGRILLSLSKLMEELEDTYTAAGSEAFVAALLIYSYAKANGVATSGLDQAVVALGQRFAQMGRRPKKSES